MKKTSAAHWQSDTSDLMFDGMHYELVACDIPASERRLQATQHGVTK